MKIALACPYDFAYSGGVQTHITSLGHQLSATGHEVKIMAPCTRGVPAYSLGDIELISFGRAIPWPSAGSIARISFGFWHERRIKSMLDGRNFDILHVHEPLMPFFSLMCSYFSGIPSVGTFHAYSEGPSKGYIMWKYLLERAVEKLSGRIAVSHAARRFANRYFPGEYTVIPNGVDLQKMSSPAQRPSIFRETSINLLFVGRLNEKRKGLRYLLGAYSLLKWTYPNLRLIVVGQGIPDRSSYQLMSERKLDDVVFVGHLCDSELAAYYQHADIFCAPNTDRESFGLVISEAMAAGTSVVASDILGFRSIAKNNETALLVSPKDEHSLAKAIKRLIEDPALDARLKANAWTHIQQFGWESIAERIVNFYEKVLEKRKPDSASIVS